jgi:hypothetical protein
MLVVHCCGQYCSWERASSLAICQVSPVRTGLRRLYHVKAMMVANMPRSLLVMPPHQTLRLLVALKASVVRPQLTLPIFQPMLGWVHAKALGCSGVRLGCMAWQLGVAF